VSFSSGVTRAVMATDKFYLHNDTLVRERKTYANLLGTQQREQAKEAESGN